MNALLKYTALVATFSGIFLVDADQEKIEKYDRMYQRLMKMTEEQGPIANLSDQQRERFMLDVRKMIADVSDEVVNEFVSIGGGVMQKNEAQKQLVLLSARYKESKTQRKILDRFAVKDSQVDFSQRKGSAASTTLHLTCHNQSHFAVSKVRVRATVVSEGRTVPWAQDDYLIRIRGGVESGETRDLTEMVAGDLAFQPPAETELKLKIKVIELFDADGQSVGRDTFSDSDRRSLADFEAIREDLYYR